VTTVLSIAYPFAPVGPNLVGGAEQILWDLDQALVAAGDRSLVVACEGSRPGGRLFAVPLPEHETLDKADGAWCQEVFHAAVDRALASEPVDVVHVHSMELYGYDFPPEIPLLITLHLPIEWYARETIGKYMDHAQFCFVSQSQRRTGLAAFGDAPVIENGVEIQPFDREGKKSDFAMVMGTGFAPFRGGPLRHADALGLPRTVEQLKRFEIPVPSLLQQLAAENRRFHEA